jgi:MFS family permease
MSDISATPNDLFSNRLASLGWWQIGLVAAILALLGLAVVFLDDLWPDLWHDGLWSILVTAPTIIVYILIIARVLEPFHLRSVGSLCQISALDDEEISLLVQETEASTRKWAAPALALGFAFGFLGTAPWASEDGFKWTLWYLALVTGLMFALLAWALQRSAADSRLSNRLQQGPLNFDIYYTSPFLPIGLQSLIVALAFVGGSTIVVFFSAAGQHRLVFFDLILHGFLIIVTLLIFFLPMRQTHKVLQAAKLAEQDNLRRHLAEAYRRLEQMSLEEKKDILSFATEVSLWQQYEERLRAVPTWPYNAGMLRTLIASILLPTFVTLGQRLMALILSRLGMG